jgi:hypothetical protein
LQILLALELIRMNFIKEYLNIFHFNLLFKNPNNKIRNAYNILTGKPERKRARCSWKIILKWILRK